MGAIISDGMAVGTVRITDMRLPRIFLLLFFGVFIFSTVSARAIGFEPITRLTESRARDVALAYTTDHVLAAWVDMQGGGLQVKRTDDLGPGHVLTASARSLAMASIGEAVLVVWTDVSGDVMASRVDGQGAPLGETVKIGDHSRITSSVAVAASADRFFVVWDGDFDLLYASVVGTDSQVHVPAMVVVGAGAGSFSPSVASNGTGFAVVWNTRPEKKVFALTFDENGVQRSFVPLLVGENASFSDVASDGKSYVVVWSGTTDASLTRMRQLTGDHLLGMEVIAGYGYAPRIAWDGVAYTMLYLGTYYNGMGQTHIEVPVLLPKRFHLRGAVTDTRVVYGLRTSPDAYAIIARGQRADFIGSDVRGVVAGTTSLFSPFPRRRLVRN